VSFAKQPSVVCGGLLIAMASNNLPLMRLTFSKRWEQVGQREDLEELLDPEPLEGHEANFCRIAASQRLIYLDHVKIQPPAAPEEPKLDFSMTVKPNAKPKPKKKILRKFARGDFVNILMGVEDAPEVNPRGLPYDPLETVLAGQQELHSKSGPEALLRQKRIAQMKQQPIPKVKRHILEKASSLLPTPLLTASSTPEVRQKRRWNLPQRLLAFSEFKTWLAEHFPSPEAAQAELRLSSPNGGERNAFCQALVQREYPYGVIGAKVFFFFCDADEDNIISWKDISDAMEVPEAPEGPSRWELLRLDAEHARMIRDQDPIEEHLIEKHRGTLQRRGKVDATHQDGLEGLLKLMWREEAEVADFLEFVFTEFKSIPMLWRFLDISKKTGIDDSYITQEEFNSAMQCLCSRTKRQPLEAHMSALFDLLDTEKQDRIRLSDILEDGIVGSGRGRKALLKRLRRFFVELTTSKSEKMKALMNLYRSPSDAFKMSANGKVTRASFMEGLRRLRYDEWHLDDLFARIDRDGSGDITLEDILAFLKEAGPGGRYGKPIPAHTMPDFNVAANRLKHSSIDASAKLSQLNDWFSEERSAQRDMQRSLRRPITSPSTMKLLSSASVPALRRDLRRMGTTTRWTVRSLRSLCEGQDRELIYSYDPAPDLAPISCGMKDLEDAPSRRRVDHCFHS